MGSGKSSFINGICNLFSEESELQNPIQAYASDTHVTTTYKLHNVSELLEQMPKQSPLHKKIAQSIRLRFGDPWGVTPENYKKLRIGDFLDAKIEPGPMTDSGNILRTPNPVDVIHNVIFIVPLTVAVSPDMLELLRSHIKEALEAGNFS